MPLRIVRAASSRSLWESCAERFLDELGVSPGPDGHAAHLWLAHRNQRDAIFERAAARGLPGWLDPPISFFSQLPGRFGIRGRPIGPVALRLLVSRVAGREGRRHGFGAARAGRGPARAHMLDAVFSELLPEGVEPDRLRRACERSGGDDFARRRDAWVADSYEALLRDLRELKRFDPRSVHALLARRIEDGGLPDAVGGAEALHLYGITSLRGRRRLLRALAEQGEVRVSVYLPLEDGPSEWEEELPIEEVEILPPLPEEPPGGDGGEGRARDGEASEGAVRVQPVPDAHRETVWVAGQVKRLLAEGEAEPHEVAVVARSGRRDLRAAHAALAAAGVPCTARLRAVLSEIPALKALLALLRAEGRGWDYRALREVLSSPYFAVEIDLRVVDHIQSTRRVEGLEGWADALARTRAAFDSEDRWRLRRGGVHEDRVEEAVAAFAAFRQAVAPLAEPGSEAEWIARTLEILAGGRLDLRRRLCRPVGERYDLVRWDQRAVLRLEGLLREWRDMLEGGDAGRETFPAAEWHARLRRLLETSELALTTPHRTGVQLLEAHEAALTPFRHLFLLHANEGEFPRAVRITGVFSEEERRRLRREGLPLTTRELALRRERALWRAVVGAERVALSYRTTDARGVPRLPSLMVPDHDPSRELPRSLDILERLEAAEWAEGIPPVREAEHRRREVQRLARVRGGEDGKPFRTADPERLRHAVLAAYAEERRAADPEGGFHPWSGWLRDPSVLARLEERFGEARVWSASQLQAYAVRPFDFFIDRVLDIQEVEEAEEETSPLAFGSVAHALLHRFYGAVLPGLPPGLDPETEALYERVANEAFRAFEEDATQWLGLPALWAVTRAEVKRKVGEFLEGELAWLARAGELPVALEHAFGGRGAGEPPPLELRGTDRAGRPARLLLRGRIDRVDRHGEGEGAWLNVIDYKSGGVPSAKGYDDGALLQTALYMAAVELLGLGEPRLGVFRSIKNRTWNAAPLKREKLDDVLPFALSIPARIRAGLFEAVQAASTDLAPWQPGPDVVRNAARLAEGTRFDRQPAEGPFESVAGEGREGASADA